MKSLPYSLGLSVAALGFVCAAVAQPAPRPPPPSTTRDEILARGLARGATFGRTPTNDVGRALATIKVGQNTITVESITEPKSNPPANVIVLGLQVQARADGLLVTRANATRAIDDRDRSLIIAGRPISQPGTVSAGQIGPSLSAMMRARQKGEFTPIGGSLNLVKPQPDARSIKVLEGELEIYAPTVENGGIVRIRKYAARPGHAIEDPVLASNGIEIIAVTPDVYQATPERFRWNARGMGPPPPRFQDGPTVYHKDPKGLFAGLLFTDSLGGYLPVNSYQGHATVDGGTLYTYWWTEPRPMPADAGLEVYVLVPGATITVPFRFENVPLP